METEGTLEPPLEDGAPPPPPELEELTQPQPALSPPTQRAGPNASFWSEWSGPLQNRLILAALGIVVVLLLVAIVLIVIGHGRGGTEGNASVSAATRENSKTQVKPIGGLAGKASTTISYRNGPGPGYTILGTIPKGAVVAVVGRSEDESWLQVRYPVNSTLKGWVDARLVNVDGDITALVIAGPGPVPNVEVTFEPPPTPFNFGTPTEEVATLTPTRTVRPSPTVRVTPTRTPRQFFTPTQPELPSATPPPPVTPGP